VSIVNKVKNSRIRYLLVGVLVVGLVFGVLSLTYAAETALHDEAPGTIITFSGKQWIILEQMPNGETYILLYDKGSGMAFDPDKTQLFDPSDPNNIAYYLNNDFLNSLSQRHLISEHSWDRVSVNFSDSLDGTDYGNVTCSIGLISYREAEKYSTYYPINYWGWWWTRTPRTESSVTVWCVNRATWQHRR
jgi:hypothetical protein